jgi:hypothetical protein
MTRVYRLVVLCVAACAACGGDAGDETEGSPAGNGAAAGDASGGASGAAATSGAGRAGAAGGTGGGGMGGDGAGGDGPDECPFNLEKRTPGQCGCTNADTDGDGDGVADCVDFCVDDPDKDERGTCGCGTPDTDSDGDGAPDCMDDAPDDPTLQDAGECGTAADPEPAGTPCDDGACSGATECDGAGHCGDLSCAPTGCGEPSFRQFRDFDYWFCPGPVTWQQAIAACREVPTRTLLQIDDVADQDLAASAVEVDSWLGANDLAVEGEWRWADSDASREGSLFWNGAADGQVYFGAFVRWSDGNPGGGTAESCAIMSASTGEWDDVACDSMHGFVCWDETGN